MMKVYCYEVAERMHSAGKEALLAFAEGDELKGMLMGLKRFTKTEPFNTTAARQSHRPEAHRGERVLLVIQSACFTIYNQRYHERTKRPCEQQLG